MTDFSAVSIFGRAYISPHNGLKGLTNQFIYVYDGTDGSFTARKAAGVPPQGFDLTLALVIPVTPLDDIVAPIAPANGVQPLTSSPYIPATSTTIKFTQTGGTVTAITITVVGIDSGNDASTKVYTNKIASAGPTTYTTGEIWKQITSITISALAGSGGTFKVESTGVPGGKFEIGYHVIGVVYETVSGFLTKPGPENNLSAIFVNKKNRAINVSGIPASPGAGISKIHIVASKFIAKKAYSGNPDPQQYEMFFVPKTSGGQVAAGVTSTTINVFDADLLDSADYLLDNLSEIPAAVTVFGTSKGRLLTGGEFTNDRIIRGSKGGEPEAFSATDGFVISDPGSGGVRNLAEYRDSIYIYKAHANLITQDNGDLLSTWTINLIDKAIGTECHGIANILGATADTQDVLIIADRAGLMSFNGAYAERPLSWKIKEIWDSIDDANFHKTQVSVDPVNKIILVCFANDVGGGAVNQLWMGDYTEGLDWQSIKWAPWEFKHATGSFIPETIASEFSPTTGKVVFRIGYRTATKTYTYQYDSSLNNDDLLAFPAHWETYKYTASNSGAITQITGMRINITGFGEVNLSLIGPQNKPIEVQSPFPIPTSSNGNILQRLNFTDDYISIKCEIDGLDETFQVSKIWLFGTELWGEKPAGLKFDLKESLISYWDLEEASGTRNDAHGTNHLTDNNTVTNALGIIGNGAKFVTANSEWLSCPVTPELGINGHDFTIVTWVKFDNFAASGTIIAANGKINQGGSEDWQLDDFFGNRTARFFYFDNISGAQQVMFPTPLTTGIFYFIAVTFKLDTLTLKIQVDDYAQVVTVCTLPPRVPIATELLLGRGPGGLGFEKFLNGIVDEVGIWKRVLTPFEREYLHNRGAGRNYVSL